MRYVFAPLFVFFSAIPGAARANPAVEVGAILPLTGPRASIGEDARAGMELALEEIRRRPDRYSQALRLRFEDSRGDPAAGVAAFRTLDAARVAAVITQNSNVSLPVSPLANHRGVLQLAITTTSDRYAAPRDLSFRTNGSTRPEAEAMAVFLARHHAGAKGAIAILVMQDEYPETLHAHLLAELSKRSLTASHDEEFLPGESDFNAIISRFRAAKAEYAVCLGYQTQCGIFVKQARERGFTPRVTLANTPVNNREFFAAAGDAADGVVVTYPQPDLGSGAAREFEHRFGRPMNFFSSNAHDAVLILGEAAKRCEASPGAACLAAALPRIGEFSGASGTKRFDENGDMQDRYELLIAREGRFVPLNEVSSIR